MQRRETLKDAFEKLYRESSFKQASFSSRDIYFNKDKLFLAKAKICSQNFSGKEEKSCRKLGNSQPKALGFSWKIKTYVRKKASARTTQIESLKVKREHLKDVIDKLHLRHLVGGNNNFLDKLKKKRKDYPFLQRNVNVVHISISKRDNERKRFPVMYNQSPRTSQRTVSLIGSKVTVRTKPLDICKPHSEEKEALRQSPTKSNFSGGSIDDSGVFVDGTESDQSLRKRNHTSVTNNEEHVKKQKIASESGNIHVQRNMVNTQSYKSRTYSSSLFPRAAVPKMGNSPRLTPKQLTDEYPSARQNKSGVFAKKSVFRPLFSSHAGEWKPIVEEN